LTEVTSDIVVAHIPGPIVLPHPKYADSYKMKPRVTEFIRFIVGCQFDGGNYA